MDDKLKTMNDGRQGKHFGVIDLTVHYTLGAGLAEQLGDDVEQAVLAAIAQRSGSSNKFYFDGGMIRRDRFWHYHLAGDTRLVRLNRALSLHLSNEREENEAYSVDWFYF